MKKYVTNISNLTKKYEGKKLHKKASSFLKKIGTIDFFIEALNNTPSVVDVITSSTILSSDAIKGLGFVRKYQALDVWDDMEIDFKKK